MLERDDFRGCYSSSPAAPSRTAAVSHSLLIKINIEIIN